MSRLTQIYTNLPRQQRTAARAYFRLLHQRTRGWDEMEGVDRHFDGGEWSGPAWADNWQREQRRTAEFVADRFDLPVEAVERAAFIMENVQSDNFMQAFFANNEEA